MTIFHTFNRAAFGSLTLGILLLSAGCGGGLIESASTPMMQAGSGLQGKVHGGQQPVSGATLQLYEVGATGYASAAKPLITSTVTTQTDGTFSITGDYTCDAGSYVYITASGGIPAGSVANPALTLMAALGACSSLTSSTNIMINEVTTVAGAYALAQFARSSSFGTPLSLLGGSQATQATAAIAPADNFATSATNIQGIANAMATAQVLASTSTGTSPGNNSNGSASVEYWQVNTLADIIAACVNSTGATTTGSACGTLFSNVAPSGSPQPADTLQAAIYMALNPTSSTQSITALYGLISGISPFLPYADSATAVADLTLAVAYTPVLPSTSTKVLSTPRQIAFDGAGNAWVTNTGNGYYLAELGPTGNPIQAGTTAGVYTTTAYTLGGASTTMSGSGSTLLLDAIALDTAGNVWGVDSNGNNIFNIPGSGGVAGGTSGGNTTAVGYSLAAGGGPGTGALPYSIAVDGSNNIWFSLGGTTGKSCGTAGTKQVGEYAAGAYGTYVAGAYGGGGPYAMAIDDGVADYTTVNGVKTSIPGAPFVWTVGEYSGGTESSGVDYGILSQQYSVTSGSTATAGCATPLSGSWIGGAGSTDTTKIPSITVGGDTINMMANPTLLAFDSSGDAWIVNNGVNDSGLTWKYSVTRLVPNYGNAFTSAQAVANFSFTSTNLSAAVSTFLPQSMAIDGGGQVWLSGAAPVLVQLSNSGSFISPATGYAGSTYTSTGPTTHSRYTTAGGNSGVAVDISGNVWVANAVSASRITVLVGTGVPVVAPFSVGVKNNTLGTKP
jgi:hypothetical protein